MKIAMIGSESNPYIKTGGLADVIYALSIELVALKEEVAVVLPLYNDVRNRMSSYNKVGELCVYLSWRKEWSNIYKEEKNGVTFYFIENRHYFERNNIYGYDDDGERFAFFSQAALAALKAVNYKPDIIHVHDWQTGMIPCLIREGKDPFFKDSKTVLTIHNPAFQGIIFRDAIGDLYNLPYYLYDIGVLRFGDVVSTLKAGIMYADKVTTVSPTHHYELLTPEGGMGLDTALRYREYDFCGFLNGIDYEEFNPHSDKYIAETYDADTFEKGKTTNKIALCERLGLSNKEAPLFAVVSRITWQKGMSLVFASVHELVKRGANVVLLGSGEYENENEMNRLHSLYQNQVAVYIGYNNALAHQIYAAIDFFMMPSLFEPCGLGQMIAQRYGSLPVVRRVGGLKDSVINYDGNNVKTSNGFGFDEFSEYEMVRTCMYALDTYYQKDIHHQLVLNALNTDNSWKKSGKQYHGLYLELVPNVSTKK